MKNDISEGINKELPDWLITSLSDYQRVDSIPQAFSDSTHHLWRLQGSTETHENHFLKVCSNTESPFWQIMNKLFEFDLNTEIAYFPHNYEFIDQACSLEIPELVKAESITNKKAFILTSELNGSAIDSNINDQMVQQLASHLAELHSNKIPTWGSLNTPKFNTSTWSNRLRSTLINSDKKWGGVLLKSNNDSNANSKNYLKQALEACSDIKAIDFVPMILDLRWDQFWQQDNSITALVDLDAFVYAPRELDFVILEYLLTSNQVSFFKETYVKQHAIPNLNESRLAYRLLLFYMQILGETDLDVWMNRKALFEIV